MFVEHPLIRRGAIEDRDYQRNIATTCAQRSTLVVLPTGMGKTVIAARVIADVLRSRGGKILLLAPTKPLVEQHATTLRHMLVVDRIAVFTGEATPPEERELLWRDGKIVVSTPQVIENDLRSGRFDLEEVALVVFDEAHRAVGDYAYVDVARAYREVRGGLVLGITASPGSSPEKILEVCGNLNIPLGGWEIRTENDPDVVPYVHELTVQRIVVRAPDVARDIRALITTVFDEQIERIKRAGFLEGIPKPSLKDLLAVGARARQTLDSGARDGRLFGVMTAQAIAMKANHAITLAETQGMAALRSYFERMGSDVRSRADAHFLRHPKVVEAMKLALESDAEHPKLSMTMEVVGRQMEARPESKVIVFAHYRDTADRVTRGLGAVTGARPVRFVGQSTRGEDVGLSQREQVDILDRFRAGEVNVIVATAIGEEGLDIPQVDLVVFYEPVPSEIRTIQRRGRTGRSAAGRVVMLVTEDTRDEAFFYSSRRKERRMHHELEVLRRALKQRLLTAGPAGGAAAEPHPAAPLEQMREAARPREEPEPPRPPRKAGQSNLDVY